MEVLIRQILHAHGDLAVPVESLGPDANLFDAGLSSFSSVEVMVALEELLGAPLPDRLLRRSTFETIAALCSAAEEVRAATAAA